MVWDICLSATICASVRALSHEVLVMKDGQVVERGPTAQIFDAPQQDYTKALLAAAL